MDKELWMVRTDISYRGSESEALADSLKRNLGLLPSPSLILIWLLSGMGGSSLKDR